MRELNEVMKAGTASGLHPVPVWTEHLRRRYRGKDRPCRHAIMGRIDGPKLCTFNYECKHCPFDQMLDETDYAH